jgi:uncharacterized protein with HEPN domain
MKPRENAYIFHIRDAIVAVESYGSTHTYEQFLENLWDQAALTRNLEIIGEASSQISDAYKDAHSEIPWRRMSDFRNVLIHEYFAIDPLLVWEILEKDIPTLKQQIENLIIR